jgi:hypothetical protein
VKLNEGFIAARRVGTPGIAVRTPDAASTITNIKRAIAEAGVIVNGKKISGETLITGTPFASWDAIHGLAAVNSDRGAEVIADLLATAQIDAQATTQLPIALSAVEAAGEVDLVMFVHNVHLFWEDPLVIQAIWNLRDKFKANGNVLVLLVPLGTVLPAELNNDLLLLEEPLPSRQELRSIVQTTYKFAKCKEPSEDTLTRAGDALVGIASFPSEQAVAMSLDKATGKLDISALWSRKKDIISACNGLSFYDGNETLADAGGLENIKKYLTALMKGKRGANIILRLDEIEKMFAGAGTDTSGVKGDLLGNFLSWVEDKKIICCLFLGVPGASKSHIIYCLGGEFGKPVLNFDVAGMQDSLVGNSGKNLRHAEATVEAISDGQIILLATANSLRGLPAELISRFEKGGIFFFDAPDATEREEILKLKIKKYGLTPEQTANVPDMTDWTGREIDSMCNKADMLDMTLAEAGAYVVPLMKSHADQMAELRMSVHNRYLSASKPGLYQYVPPPVKETHHASVVTTPGRKMRD